ncbi:FecCD family ABC transporter permease [Azospirillum canadense]|uniref:FecCD family ABC transporter permease n=1 Tax=Azospirillum canadense TaxID=403962 RepID=UPI002227450C|nr:iron ABC transporter permease [Azospirillum canadense]MCW2241485.1 iron complex transport system permease protein [Azospirillum canadense]
MTAVDIRTGPLLRSGYRQGMRRRVAVTLWMSVLLAGLILLDLVTGPSPLSVGDALFGLLRGPANPDGMTATIIWSIRLPITLMGVLVGISLGIAGLQMQTILDNPLASPFTLGFSAAAGFGAALAIMFGAALPIAAWLLTPLAAFAATLVSCGLIYGMARARGANPEILTLGGIAVMFLFQALQSLLQFLASPEVLQQIVFWLFGSLMKANWTSVMVLGGVLLVTVPLLARDAWRLTSLRLGDAHARSLGLDADALRRRTFGFVALLTAAAVAFVGTIGFIGLVAPHAARALVGEDQRVLMPLTALMGAALLVGASVVSKIIAQGAVIPVGIVTAVVGVPVLFTLVMRRGAGGWG